MAGFFKKLMEKKEERPSQQTWDIISNLKLLAEAEANIAAFYKLCSETAGNGAELWTSMAQAELRHAEYLKKMSSLIAEEPELYTPGYSFNPASIRLFSLHVQSLMEEMKEGKIPPDKLSSLALEIESSAVELNVGKIVETEKEEYNKLARQIESESQDHFQSLSQKESEGT